MILWLVDECVDGRIARKLRESGHDIALTTLGAPGISDVEVIAQAQREGRILLTEDKDFGELVFHRRMDVPGVVLLRGDPADYLNQWNRLKALIDTMGDSLLGKYVVVEAKRVRTRELAGRER